MNLENDKTDLRSLLFKDLINNFNKKKKFLNMIEEIEFIVEENEITIYD
jgi:hypothetical protein